MACRCPLHKHSMVGLLKGISSVRKWQWCFQRRRDGDLLEASNRSVRLCLNRGGCRGRLFGSWRLLPCHDRTILAEDVERDGTTMMRLTILVKLRCSRPVTIEPIILSTSTSEAFICGASGPY